MCDYREDRRQVYPAARAVSVGEAVGMFLAHDVTEIRQDEFKGRAFKKGHLIQLEDIPRFKRIGKEHVFVLNIDVDELHEDAAARALAAALMGEGVAIKGEPREGKVTLIAAKDGLLKIDKDALLEFNMLGDVLCATRHGNTIVKRGSIVAGTKAVPLVVKRAVIEKAVSLCRREGGNGSGGVISIKDIRKPKAGVVITGNEVYYGHIRDSFAPVVSRKIEGLGGEVVGTCFAPDDRDIIKQRLRELLAAGADLLITTGGMSVDPDDVTRFAIRDLGATDLTYGSPILPGAMVLVGYLPIAGVELRKPESEKEKTSQGQPESGGRQSEIVPILGIPACGMYHQTTVVDLILPRLLAGEKIGRRDLAELGYGGLCLGCPECRYPVCPFGK